MRAIRRAAVPTGLPVVLFGGIFSGATTVTEAALIAVVYALVAGVFIGGIQRAESYTAERIGRNRAASPIFDTSS